MSTVKELLEGLVAGRIGLADVVADFQTRQWPRRRRATDAEFWGEADTPTPGENDWDLVTTNSALTPDQYLALAQAYTDNVKGTGT